MTKRLISQSRPTSCVNSVCSCHFKFNTWEVVCSLVNRGQPSPFSVRVCMVAGSSLPHSGDAKLDEITRFSGFLNIKFCKDRWFKDTQNLKHEDKRIQNCLVMKTEDFATKLEDWRFKFLTEKIWLLVWLTEKTTPRDTSPFFLLNALRYIHV